MCLLALFFRVADDAPVVVGANREEFYHRGGTPPQLLPGPPRAVAGLDPEAGGTWLGVNEHGVLIAVTNRPQSDPPREPRSRGLLARDLLASRNAFEASDRAAHELGKHLYAGCNFLIADAERATVIHAGDWLRVRPLPPGLHVLTNRDVDDPTDQRAMRAAQWLSARPSPDADQLVRTLEELCALGGADGPPICLHGDDRGTVSSTLVVLRQPLARSRHLHCQGPPDRTSYVDYSPLLHRAFLPA